MKIPTVITTLIPKKKKLTPLQKIARTVTQRKKQLPILQKQLMKKWRKSSLRKTLKAKGKKPMFTFKKRTGFSRLPQTLLQRMP